MTGGGGEGNREEEGRWRGERGGGRGVTTSPSLVLDHIVKELTHHDSVNHTEVHSCNDLGKEGERVSGRNERE